MSVDWGDGLQTGINISGGPARTSLTNGSSARKFIAVDQFENPVDDLQTRSNAEHIVDSAAGMKTLSMLVEQVAANARDTLATVREAIDQVTPGSQPDQRSYPPSFSENDLAIMQGSMATDALGRLGDVPLEVRGRLNSTAGEMFGNSLTSFIPIVQQGNVNLVNTAVPEFDNVTVTMNKKKGVTDCFYTTLSFNLPGPKIANKQIRAIRIFRAEINDQNFLSPSGRLSARALDILRADPNQTRAKNQDYTSNFENRLQLAGIDNAISALNAVDPVQGIRTGAVSGTIVDRGPTSAIDRPSGDNRISTALGSFIDPTGLENLDLSVALDQNSIANLIRSNPQLALNPVPDYAPSGQLRFIESTTKMGLAQLQQVKMKFSAGVNNMVTNQPNKLSFKEIAFISPTDRTLTAQVVGDMVQFMFDDPTVMFGRSYKYYIVSVDSNMNESTRSRMVQVNIDGLRVPDAPKMATANVIGSMVSLVIRCDDQLVEKFEIYCKEEDVPISNSRQQVEAIVHAPNSGFMLGTKTSRLMKNGFLHVGDCLNGGPAGGSFYDRGIRIGRRYTYRVYSVDIFGNKSESPKEVSIFVPDPKMKNVELRKPSILAEVDSKTNNIRLTFSVDDPRVVGLFIGRRNATLSQQAFVPPGQPNSTMLGRATVKGQARFLGPIISDGTRDSAWTGYFERIDGPIVFVDKTAVVDHTYQYRVHGIDKFGNLTPYEFSKQVFVSNLPMIDEPINLSASLAFGTDGRPNNVHLSWDNSNIDISSEDRLGNRNSLAATAVRTLYQIERRKLSEDSWKRFPMIEGESLDDQVSVVSASSVPGFRPDLLQVNETYIYRVSAYLSGGFISNFSSELVVPVITPIATPVNFRITNPDTKQAPFFVVLNWDTPIGSGDVDHWDVEVCAVNNQAAANLNMSNPADFAKLVFKPFRTIFLESSRFRELQDDQSIDLDRSATGLFTGQHHYLDSSVGFGNTYFYRIRAASVVGEQLSDWTYRGIRVTDATAEKKNDVVTTPEEKSVQAGSPSPILPIVSPPPPIVGDVAYITPTQSPPTSTTITPVTSPFPSITNFSF